MRPASQRAALWIVLGIGLGLTTSLAAPTSFDLEQARRFYMQATLALRSGNVSKARKYYGEAIRVFPAFPEAHIGMGQVAMTERRFQDALGELERARDGYRRVAEELLDAQARSFTRPHGPVVSLPGAHCPALDLGGSWPLEAMEVPRPSTSSEPPGIFYFYLGNALFHLDRIGEAIDAWETCCRRKGSFPLAFNNLAVGYWKMGCVDKALETLTRAEQLGLAVNYALKADLQRSLPASPGARVPTTSRPPASRADLGTAP